MIVVGLAYPAPPRGSHKGVSLRWCLGECYDIISLRT